VDNCSGLIACLATLPTRSRRKLRIAQAARHNRASSGSAKGEADRLRFLTAQVGGNRR